MKYPKIKLIFDRKKRGSETKSAAVEIELTYGGKRKWISTGVSLYPNQWDSTKETAKGMDNADNNMRIENMLRPVRNHINRLMLDSEPFTWEGLEAAIASGKNEGSFIRFAEERIDERTDITEGTRRNHKKLITALESFGKMRLFTQVTRANILAFDQWLHTKNYVQSTVHSYHKFLKVYIHEAIIKGLIDKDPYLGIRIEEGKSAQRKYLTEEEIEKIKACKSLTPSLQRVRDMFLFQYYTGLAYADMKKFDFTKAVKRNGKYVIHDVRTKSNIDYYIVLLSPAVRILRKYGFMLPTMTNEQYNMRLKSVADCAKVTKRITSHMARHSFAVNSLNAGIPIEVVSRMLGHTNVQTTQIYAKVMNKTVEEAFKTLEKKMKVIEKKKPNVK